MKAFFAILKDSLREAAASRVLAVALLAIVFVLALLSPLGLSVSISTALRPYEVPDLEKFLANFAEQRGREKTPAAHVWGMLDDNQQGQFQVAETPEAVQKAKENGRPVAGRNQLLQILNEQFKKAEFFQPENWSSINLDDELKTADSGLTEETLASRNLKRFAAAFPESIGIRSDTALSLSYGSITLFGPLSVPPEQRDRLINETIVIVLSLFLGFFGVFTSVIITASIIPRALEPGEISLLLSKPIRRTTMFLTKFAGGCVFTLICAVVLVAGVWLLLWVRMGLWRPELLLCIPLYIFLFAIYSSVSSLAGVIWRNTTVSLVVVVLFWIVITTAGAVHDFMAYAYLPPRQIAEIATAGDQVLVMHGGRSFSRWSTEAADWQDVLEASGSQMPFRALARLSGSSRVRLSLSSDGEQVMTFNPETSRFGGVNRVSLISGRASEDFMREVEGSTPDPVFGVYFTTNGEVLLPGTQGILKFQGSSEQEKKTREFLGSTLTDLMSRMQGSRSVQTFQPISEKPAKPVALEAGVAFNSGDDSFIYWDEGRLWTMARDAEGRYVEEKSRTFEPSGTAVVGSGGSLILIATSQGSLIACDRLTLETIAEGSLDPGEKPRVAEVSPDGQLGCVLTHSGQVVTFDLRTKSFGSWNPPENGKISAVAYTGESSMLVASGRALTAYDSENHSVVKKWTGKTGVPETLYKSVVEPLHRVLPKPQELNLVVRYLVTGESSTVINGESTASGLNPQEDLNRYRVTRDLQQAFLSSAAFIAVTLAIACVILIRTDF